MTEGASTDEFHQPQRLAAVYQGLNARISDNFDLQWRGPTFALTAQAFLFAAWAGTAVHPLIQGLFGLMVFLVGVVAATVMSRVQRLLETDEILLDRLEARLLPSGLGDEFRLHHQMGANERARKVTGVGGKGSYRVFPNILNSTLWSSMLLCIGLAGLGLGIWSLTF